MDMNRILQAMDGISTKPVEGASSMAKFLSIVDNNAKEEVLNEAKNPHKVSLPVQMAMQHYQKEDKPVVKQQARVGRDSIVGKYFHDVSEEFAEEKSRKRQLINQYASNIAERVMMREAANPAQQAAIAVKENEVPGHSMGFNPTGGPGMGNYVVDETPLELDRDNPMSSTIHSHQGVNPASIQARIMRARRQLQDLAEQSQSDSPLAWQHIARLFPELAMNIEQINHGLSELKNIRSKGGKNSRNIPALEAKTIKPKSKTDPCWNNYQQIGMKMKDGKSVPNCVKKK
jgi:hypothetical protein